MQLTQAVNNVFEQLNQTLIQLSGEEYCRPCTTLSGSTVGQHLRHIIELFQCLEEGYSTGRVNYENRRRDKRIETDKDFASSLMTTIQDKLNRPDREMMLEASYDELNPAPMTIATNYYREIAYNLEHSIHHMALIRIGIREISGITLPENFGIASSTVKYRNQCAQ